MEMEKALFNFCLFYGITCVRREDKPAENDRKNIECHSWFSGLLSSGCELQQHGCKGIVWYDQRKPAHFVYRFNTWHRELQA
jgi:hypothetical protein